MSTKRGFVETYLLGIADDIPSTNRLLTVSRVTHWVCFLVAVGGAIQFANLYFKNGTMWNETPDRVPDRMLIQIVANQNLWLFVAGVALLAGFISWLNTDVLMNRKILLEQSAPGDSAVVRTTAMPAVSSETPTGTPVS
jgi:hypothetical protein